MQNGSVHDLAFHLIGTDYFPELEDVHKPLTEQQVKAATEEMEKRQRIRILSKRNSIKEIVDFLMLGLEDEEEMRQSIIERAHIIWVRPSPSLIGRATHFMEDEESTFYKSKGYFTDDRFVLRFRSRPSQPAILRRWDTHPYEYQHVYGLPIPNVETGMAKFELVDKPITSNQSITVKPKREQVGWWKEAMQKRLNDSTK